MEYFKCEQDIHRSRDLAKLFPQYIRKNRCYRNVWDLVVTGRVLSKNQTWKVAYGCVVVAENIFAAHAFFYDAESGKVVDPTLPKEKELAESYYVAALYNEKEYLYMAEKSRYLDPVMNKDLKKVFEQFQLFALENGFAIII